MTDEIPTETDVSSATTLYDAVGGQPFFDELVDRFYGGVELDPQLLAVYPQPSDLAGARHRLSLFLAQYWGGPSIYSDERGHPRLRMRHATFTIGQAERDRWLEHMRAAVDEMDPPEDVRAALLEYFDKGSAMLQNQE